MAVTHPQRNGNAQAIEIDAISLQKIGYASCPGPLHKRQAPRSHHESKQRTVTSPEEEPVRTTWKRCDEEERG